MSYFQKLPKIIGISAVLGAMVLISGCAQSVTPRDSISASFGNAMASNTALQTVDPWPRNVENTHIHTDGVKSSNAIETYRTPPEVENVDGSSITVSEIAPAN